MSSGTDVAADGSKQLLLDKISRDSKEGRQARQNGSHDNCWTYESNVDLDGVNNVVGSRDSSHADHTSFAAGSVIAASEDSDSASECEGLLKKYAETTASRGRERRETRFLLYLSHFLSAWGDRMWTFAVGLFLVEISPGSLQLTAAYGLVLGGSVLLGGPLIGRWVDSTQRLTAARVSIVAQNVLTAMCAAVVFAQLTWTSQLSEWLGVWSPDVQYAAIITLTSLANLASVANTIAVEKDWIVEICSRDEARLAEMSATMRAIDLTTQILAPVATGLVMTYASVPRGAVFTGTWNLVSMVVEYYLIWWVYKHQPELAKPKEKRAPDVTNKQPNETNGQGITEVQQPSGDDTVTRQGCFRWDCLCSGVVMIVRSWKTFASYRVMLSGISLSMLYLTVLGFDNVTVGYARLEGLNETIIGVLMGLGGLVGIIGASTYPAIRRCLGLACAGLVGLSIQTFCLGACLVSVWLPGSPFDLSAGGGNSSDPSGSNTTTIAPSGIIEDKEISLDISLLSVTALMVGIVTSRFGLWVADLSINQMFLHSVAESERGVVNGVQTALNQLQDMVKFGLVVALPRPEQFGLLVIISFLAVLTGMLLYIVYLARLPRGMFSRRDNSYSRQNLVEAAPE